MKVRDLMTSDVVVVEAEERLEQAAKKLRKHGISGAPVVEGSKVLGVLSEADLLEVLEEKDVSFFTVLPSPFEVFELPVRVKLGLEKAAKRTGQVAKMRVKEVMSEGAITIPPESDISEAARIIRERDINRLPVVEKGKLVGIITRADLLEAL